MPLTVNVGISRKASANYQSAGLSINVTAELDQSLLADGPRLQSEIDRIYRQAEEALDRKAGGDPERSARPQKCTNCTERDTLTSEHPMQTRFAIGWSALSPPPFVPADSALLGLTGRVHV
jgi:hypothetical protein